MRLETSRGLLLTLMVSVSLLQPLPGQTERDIRKQDETQWAKSTGLSVETVHRLWRSTSHFADENEEDSRIVLIDKESLASRNQLLMVTRSGVPECLTVSVFSTAAGNFKVWSESKTPQARGFCESLGIEPTVSASSGRIVVTAPNGLISEHASHADVGRYIYVWTGRTYTFGHKETFLQFVPEENRKR